MSRAFDGTGDFLEVASALVTGAPCTFSAWYKRSGALANDYLVQIGVAASADNCNVLQITSAGAVAALTSVTSGQAAITARVTSDTDTWHHAAAVFTSAALRAAYHDYTGTSDTQGKATNTASRAPVGQNRTHLGGNLSGINELTGKLAHVAIWNVALDDSEIASLAAGAVPTTIRSANLVAYWTLTASLADSSGNGNTLTATNTTNDADIPPAFSSSAPAVQAATYQAAIDTDGKRRTGAGAGDTTAPNVPTLLAVSVLGPASVQLTCTEAVDAQSGLKQYVWERSADGSTGWTQVGVSGLPAFSDTSLSASTLYYWRVKSQDNRDNVSAASNIVSATTTAAALVWPLVAPSSGVPIIPGLGGFGITTPAGSGRHTTPTTTSVIIVDRLTTSATDGAIVSVASGNQPALYRGSLRYALERNFPRTIVFETSGMYDVQRTQSLLNQYCTVAFQTAPSPGFFLKNGNIQVTGSDTLLWHMNCYNGDEASGQNFDVRRGFTFGAGVGTPARCVVAWSSMYWGNDCTMGAAQGGTDLTMAHCIFAEGLAVPSNPEYPHSQGPTLLDITNVVLYRCLMAHNKSRNPLTRLLKFSIVNCVSYDTKGDTGIASNSGSYGMDFAGNGSTSLNNVLGNLFIKGPNFSSQYGGTRPIYVRGTNDASVPLGAASRICMLDNVAHGYTYTSQAELATLSGTPPPGVLTSTVQSTAISAELLTYLVPDTTAFLTLCQDTIGARPGDRAAGRDATVWSHVLNRIAGTSPQGVIPEATTDVGGVFTVSVVARDLLNSVAMGGDPLPLSTWLAPGVNPNYTVGEEWLYRQHLAVM